MCAIAAAFPSKIHSRGIVRCSVKCDTLSWGPLRSPLLISQGEDRLTHGILTTHVPALHSSVWKLKLWTTAGEMAALASPCTYQLVPEPGWGHTDDCGSTWGALSSGLRVSPKYTSGDSLTEPRSVNENYGQWTIFVLHIKPRAWLSVLTSGERKNIDNSKENIPKSICFTLLPVGLIVTNFTHGIIFLWLLSELSWSHKVPPSILSVRVRAAGTKTEKPTKTVNN